jgi:hypothetical protein
MGLLEDTHGRGAHFSLSGRLEINGEIRETKKRTQPRHISQWPEVYIG